MKHKHMKALSVLLTVCMIVGLLPWTVLNAKALDGTTSGSCGSGVTWAVTENGDTYTHGGNTYTNGCTLTISGNGAMSDFASNNAPTWYHWYGERVTRIVIESGVTHIGAYAFGMGSQKSSCPNVVSVSIPDTVTSIGAYAFGGDIGNPDVARRCSKLTGITIPSSVTNIGTGAFCRCTGLTTVTIPGTANHDTVIGPSAFAYCTNLATATIGDGVKSIGDGAFARCDALNTVSIGKNVESIDRYAFYRSGPGGSIGTFSINENNQNFDSSGLFVIDKITNTLTGCFKVPSDGTIVIPSGVEKIGDSAFTGKTAITSVIIPASVTSVGQNAFFDTGLTSVIAPAGLDLNDAGTSGAQIKYICTAPTAPTPTALTYSGSSQTYALPTGAGYTVDGVTATNAGSYTATATLTAGSNPLYVWGDTSTMIPATGTAATAPKTYAWSITAKPVENPTITVDACNYTGAALTPAVTVKDGNTTIPASEYKVSYSNNINAAESTAANPPTVTITDKTGGNYTVSGTKTFTIGKGTFGNQTASGKAKATGGSGTVDLSALIVAGGALGSPTVTADANSVLDGAPTVAGNTLTFAFKNTATATQTATVEIPVTSDNYADYTITATLTVTDKAVPTLTVSNISKTYDATAVTAADIHGTAKVGSDDIEGVWSFVGTPNLTAVADSGPKTVRFTPTDTGAYETVDATITLTVNKANVTGNPTFTAITSAGKTLGNAGLTGTFAPAGGALAWDDGDAEPVTQGRAYGWTYTPTDSANYNVRTGTLTPWAAPAPSYSGGSSSSGDDTPSTPSTTTTNADGSKTTTTKNADGSTTAVTTKQDGSTVTVNTAKDGSAVTTEKTADGSTATVKTDKSGSVVSTEVNPSAKAIEDAAKSGEPVTLPVEVRATGDAGSASEVKVTLPKGETGVRVEIPVENLTSGTVAVIVNPDGTEEIVKTSTTGEDGVVLTLEESATVKLVDNTKSFSDVQPNDWFAPYIAWAASRGIMNGMGDGTFAPNDPTTQGMMEQLLYNLDGNALVPAAEGEAWWSAADRWADSKGVTQGLGAAHDPAAPAAREADILMMFNYAKAKGYDVSARADLSRFPDAASVSEEAREAVAWAVAVGLINGTTDENGSVILDPQGVATRAQVAAIVERFCEKVAK